jgi:hypothetical protein
MRVNVEEICAVSQEITRASNRLVALLKLQARLEKTALPEVHQFMTKELAAITARKRRRS